MLIFELSPLCHKEQQLKIKIGKAVKFGGSAKRNTYVYVRFASWSKFPIWQWPFYLVADEKKFLRSSRKVSLASGLNLSDIIEKQLLYNISAPAVLILHLAATGDRARVVLARLAPEILHSAFLPSGQNFLQPVQQAVVSAGAA